MRLTIPPTLKRLTTREYLPMAGWIGTYAMIGIALGHADAVRLLAANTFVQAARAFCTLEIVQTLALRIGAPVATFAISRRRAVWIDTASLIACLLAMGGIAALLIARDMEVVGWMVVGMAFGVPARHPMRVLLVKRRPEVSWRLGVAVASLLAGAAVLLLGLDWWWAAVLFGLRDWGGLFMTLVAGRLRTPVEHPRSEPMAFDELAARTENTARRRLTYRLAKSVLAGVLGPFGTLIARTGRGVRLDSKLSNKIPRHRGGMTALTLVAAALCLVSLMLTREPALILLAAAAARIAGSGGSALLWWNYGGAAGFDEDDEDD